MKGAVINLLAWPLKSTKEARSRLFQFSSWLNVTRPGPRLNWVVRRIVDYTVQLCSIGDKEFIAVSWSRVFESGSLRTWAHEASVIGTLSLMPLILCCCLTTATFVEIDCLCSLCWRVFQFHPALMASNVGPSGTVPVSTLDVGPLSCRLLVFLLLLPLHFKHSTKSRV